MVDLSETDFVVIESGPIKGVEPTTTWWSTRSAARNYIDGRRGLFTDIDLCRVLTRVRLDLVPTETIEGDPL
jgi:hypothetical protein